MLKKNLFTTALLSVMILSVGALMAQKRQVVLDRVVAVVGGSSILYSEVVDQAKTLVADRRAQGYTSDRDPMNEGLEMLMRRKLLYNQALIDSLTPPSVDGYVEEQLQQMIAKAGSIAELEVKQHMPLYNFREILRQQITEQQYAQDMQAQITSEVKVTPGEVEQYFNSLKEEEKPLIPEQYVYAHIVRYPSSQEEAKLRAKERLLEMRERIISGKSSMAVLARTYSVDVGSAMQGGELPAGPLSGLTKPYADALAKLKPGQISEVVESEFGFHIIELIEEPKNGMYRSRHILLKPSYTIEEQIEPTEYLDSLVAYIKNDSITFEVAAKEHSQDDLSKMNGGLVSNHDLLMNNPAFANVQYTQTKFRREDFGSGKNLNDYMALTKLKPGEVSTAFISEDVKGNPISKIVKLLEVIPTHAASLNEDYLTVEEMALEDKKFKHFEKWLQGKIDEIYVYVAPDFREGEFMYKNWIK